MEAYQRLKNLVAEVESDLEKAMGGNRAAQTRVRKVMQDIKSAAQDIREGLLEIRKQDGTDSKEKGT
ncbi:MAG: histone H1 [Phycisphaerales bacterium]